MRGCPEGSVGQPRLRVWRRCRVRSERVAVAMAGAERTGINAAALTMVLATIAQLYGRP